MAFFKKIVSMGLVASMVLPMAVYAAATGKDSKPIEDNSGNSIGTFSCEADTTQWAAKVTLKAGVWADDEDITLPKASFSWEKSESKDTSTGETYNITANGVYTVKVQFEEGSSVSADNIEIEVKNIDTTGPEISEVKQDKDGWTNGSITLTFICKDSQSGTKASAYSYDGQKTWVETNTYTVTENKTIEFAVRDAVGNVTTKTVVIEHIDLKAPVVSLKVENDAVISDTNSSVKLVATASDELSGLADAPYSWDDGKTWVSTNTLEVYSKGTYSVMVRDKAGNNTTASVEVKSTIEETETETETETERPKQRLKLKQSPRPKQRLKLKQSLRQKRQSRKLKKL